LNIGLGSARSRSRSLRRSPIITDCCGPFVDCWGVFLFGVVGYITKCPIEQCWFIKR
jgi:hypothetical protein